MTNDRPNNPIDRRIAIMDLFDSGEWSGTATVQQLADRLGSKPQSIQYALRQLAFTIARRESTRREPTGHGRRTRKVKIPREWARPSQWPELYELQRRLRRMGMSASSVKNCNVSTVPARYVDQAIGEVFLAHPGEPDAVKKRGVYKKALTKVVQDAMLDTVPVNELAAKLGEDPATMTRAGLLNRAEGYMRVATRQELRERDTFPSTQ